jgi:putative transposase
MAKIARVVARDLSHHVTQRGNRRQTTFFKEANCETYIDQMAARL